MNFGCENKLIITTITVNIPANIILTILIISNASYPSSETILTSNRINAITDKLIARYNIYFNFG